MKNDSRKLSLARVHGLVVQTALRAGDPAATTTAPTKQTKAAKQAEAMDAYIRS